MLSVSRNLNNISHPLVASMYMKRDFLQDGYTEDVLVIETVFAQDEETGDNFDSYLIDLLTDLEDLKNKVENSVGSFDRIDIRPH